MSAERTPSSEPFGVWRKRRYARPGTTFEVERVVGHEVEGNYWFPHGRYTSRRGRMSVANLLSKWERVDA